MSPILYLWHQQLWCHIIIINSTHLLTLESVLFWIIIYMLSLLKHFTVLGKRTSCPPPPATEVQSKGQTEVHRFTVKKIISFLHSISTTLQMTEQNSAVLSNNNHQIISTGSPVEWSIIEVESTLALLVTHYSQHHEHTLFWSVLAQCYNVLHSSCVSILPSINWKGGFFKDE